MGNIGIIVSPLEGTLGAILPDPAPTYLSGNFPGKDIFQRKVFWLSLREVRAYKAETL